MRIHSEELV